MERAFGSYNMVVKRSLFTVLVIYIVLSNSIFATYVEMVERKRSDEEGLFKSASMSSVYKPWTMRRSRRHLFSRMTDAGYGSRLFVTSGLVRALIARRNIFGVYGPGKKK